MLSSVSTSSAEELEAGFDSNRKKLILSEEDKENLKSLANWRCTKKDIGGVHILQPAPLTGFYKLHPSFSSESTSITDIVVKRDSRHDRNIIEVFAANFLKGLMHQLYDADELIAHTGFIYPSESDEKPYVYSVRFEGNVLYQDATVAALSLDNSPLSDEEKKAARATKGIVPNGPGLSTTHMNAWFLNNPGRYNQDYLQLVVLSLFLGDPDIHSGNFIATPDQDSVSQQVTLSVSNEGNKTFNVYEKVRLARFDFGGIRHLTSNVFLRPVQGLFHYNPFTGPPFHFAAFARPIRKNQKVYASLVDISLLTIPQLKACIDHAVDCLKGYCTKEDLKQFIQAQSLPIEFNHNDDVDILLTKIKRNLLYLYTARKASCEYQMLEFLLSLTLEERTQFLNNHPHTSKLLNLSSSQEKLDVTLSLLQDETVSSIHIKRLMCEFDHYLYSSNLSIKEQYAAYKRFLYKKSASIIFADDLKKKLDKRIQKYQNTPHENELQALKAELEKTKDDAVIHSIYCRYQLVKYIATKDHVVPAQKLLQFLKKQPSTFNSTDYRALKEGTLGQIFEIYHLKNQEIASRLNPSKQAKIDVSSEEDKVITHIKTRVNSHFQSYMNPSDACFPTLKKMSRSFNDSVVKEMKNDLLKPLERNDIGKTIAVIKHQLDFVEAGKYPGKKNTSSLRRRLLSIEASLLKNYRDHAELFYFMHHQFNAYLRPANPLFLYKRWNRSFDKKEILQFEIKIMQAFDRAWRSTDKTQAAISNIIQTEIQNIIQSNPKLSSANSSSMKKRLVAIEREAIQILQFSPPARIVKMGPSANN